MGTTGKQWGQYPDKITLRSNQETIVGLKALALRVGLVVARGQQKGQGSIHQLIEAIVELPEERKAELVEWLREDV